MLKVLLAHSCIISLWEWCSHCLRLKFNLWNFIHVLIMKNIHIGRKLMGSIILRWNVAVRKQIYWLLDENSIFMQNDSVKHHLLFVLRGIFIQEYRQRNKWIKFQIPNLFIGTFLKIMWKYCLCLDRYLNFIKPQWSAVDLMVFKLAVEV